MVARWAKIDPWVVPSKKPPEGSAKEFVETCARKPDRRGSTGDDQVLRGG
ncbi:MAG: hypothetical protein ACI80K_001260, partial [Paracoccaceae bacterium]